MTAQLYRSATEYVYTPLTITRGSVSNIVSVGVYFTTTVNSVPASGDFTTVTLADGTKTPPDPLAVAGQVDVVALIGPKSGANLSLPTPGDYQGFVCISTANEFIIRKTDVLTIL